ncbi:hypothetical protein SAMN04487820_101135 [Actinopolyspora mzabensis]|uniref:Proteins of 100 residues with WXG n=1 Tax=Actinopolyspora mzabensis TaxID=995066 RepID=A0A1G8VK82_ACTMZ|nr:hypothetical protein [Actinopolyspora mzabensis]SDJ66344.1 hypothetical protein SAMN04487820_101135 [Actinopolyspora mzabensis]
MAGYADVVDPTRRLTTPGDYGAEVRAAAQEALGAIGEIDSAFQTIVGWSPAQELLEWVGGNWGQLLSLRDTWENLAKANLDLKENLESGLGALEPLWEGNAATAFENHMGQWNSALEQNHDACIAIRDKLIDLAENAQQTVDMVIQTILTVASIVTAALSSFSIPVYGQGKAIKAVWDTVKLINDVRKVVTAFINLVKYANEFFQSVQEIADDKTPVVNVELPDSGYVAPSS